MASVKSIGRRAVVRGSFFLGASLPFLKPLKAAAAAPDDIGLKYVHPELRKLAALIKVPPLSLQNLPQNRALNKSMARPRLADIPVEEKRIPGGPGNPEMTIYLVNAKAGMRRAGIVHTHGGGFVSGAAATSVRDMQDLCKTLDCVAITIEYRLAPETRWQGSVEDNYAGLKWFHDNAEIIGLDPARIALLGESAGGGHAALLAIKARDRGEVPVAFQCLIYPMLDDRTGVVGIVPPQVGRIIWTAESNRFGWESFLGQRPGTRSVPVAAVPARTRDLAGLPPAFIGVGSLDLFHAEDVDYAQRLNAAGVSTELIVVPGGFHGFDILPPPTQIARWFNEAKMAALRQGLGIPATA